LIAESTLAALTFLVLLLRCIGWCGWIELSGVEVAWRSRKAVISSHKPFSCNMRCLFQQSNCKQFDAFFYITFCKKTACTEDYVFAGLVFIVGTTLIFVLFCYSLDNLFGLGLVLRLLVSFVAKY